MNYCSLWDFTILITLWITPDHFTIFFVWTILLSRLFVLWAHRCCRWQTTGYKQSWADFITWYLQWTMIEKWLVSDVVDLKNQTIKRVITLFQQFYYRTKSSGFSCIFICMFWSIVSLRLPVCQPAGTGWGGSTEEQIKNIQGHFNMRLKLNFGYYQSFYCAKLFFLCNFVGQVYFLTECSQ